MTQPELPLNPEQGRDDKLSRNDRAQHRPPKKRPSARNTAAMRHARLSADELREWEKTFPDELWEQLSRLTNWKGNLHNRPKWWGRIVMELIFDVLDPNIAAYLQENKPKPNPGQNYHQWLTQDVRLNALLQHIFEIIIGIAKTCQDIGELRQKVALCYGTEPVQLTMKLPLGQPTT